MDPTKSTADRLDFSDGESADMSERRDFMEAFMLEFDLATVTNAQADRDPATSAELRAWAFEKNEGVSGRRVPGEWLKHWPSRAVAPLDQREPTAWINAAGYSVCPAVKDVIEALAPGIHQFIPFVLDAGPKGHRKEYPYFSLHVADRADDVIVEKSDVTWIQSKIGVKYWIKRMDTPIAIPKKSIRGKHIWWNRQCNILLVSGELHDRLVQQGLASGLEFQKQIVE